MAMVGAGMQLSTKFLHNQVYLRVYKTHQRGHKLPAYINFRKSPDQLVNV